MSLLEYWLFSLWGYGTELNVINKQIAQEDLAEADVKKLLQNDNRIFYLTRETATELWARLRKAATAINEEE